MSQPPTPLTWWSPALLNIKLISSSLLDSNELNHDLLFSKNIS